MSQTGTRKKIRLLSDDLDAVLHGQQWGRQAYLFSLAKNWPAIAGKEMAQHSMPAYFRRKALWIYVSSSIWMQQLQLTKIQLLESINARLEENHQIEELRCLVQPAGFVDSSNNNHPPPRVAPNPEAEQKFYALAENIPDPVTREAFCNMWRSLMTVDATETLR